MNDPRLTASEPGYPEPMDGFVPLGPVSDRQLLWQGKVQLERSGQVLGAATARVAVEIRGSTRLVWTVDLDSTVAGDQSLWGVQSSDDDDTDHFVFRFAGAEVRLPVRFNASGRAWSPTAQTGGGAHDLVEVRAHWINLPQLRGGERLHHTGGDGVWREYAGHWTLSTLGWEIAIDARPDASEIIDRCSDERGFAFTHVMSLRRSNGGAFSGPDAQAVLDGLQVGISFAIGRWAAPFLPVGTNSQGRVVWSSWAPLHSDYSGHAEGGWWVEHRPQDLRALLEKFLALWGSDAERRTLGFAATSAIVSGRGGFVEQRLMTALAALEQLSWVSEVNSGRMTEEKWRSKPAAWRFRRLIDAMKLDAGLDPATSAALAAYRRDTQLTDGPAVVASVRDLITHPKDTANIYDRYPQLVAEASRLAGKYLELSILFKLGFEGYVSDRTRTRGWVGECDPVPWTATP